MNYVYEYIAYCTSIIAKETDGTIMHMRILDFGFAELQKVQTYIGEFYKGGKKTVQCCAFRWHTHFPNWFQGRSILYYIELKEFNMELN